MIVPCPIAIDCSSDPDFPISNYSAEGPEQVPEYPSVVFPDLWDKMGCLSLCTSTISQNAADLCALAQQAQCPPPVTMFFNSATTCSCVCAGGSEFFYTVPAGVFAGQTQAIANALATAFCHTRCSSACVPPGGGGGGGGGGGFRLGEIPSGCLGAPYSKTIPSSGPAVLWTIIAGVLPDGLQLDGSTGLISGTPTTVGSSSFQIRAYNSDGNYAQQNYALCIVEISPITLPDAENGVAYNQTLVATACAPGTLTWQVTAGFLPLGLTLNAITGVISGTPTFETAFTFSVSVNSATFSCTKEYTITVNPCANITTASPLPDATEGAAYSEQLVSIGVTNPVWSVTSGALPAGLTLSVGGLISGTPTGVGGYGFTITVTGDD